MSRLGLGIGWRPALAQAIERREDLGFVELMAEAIDPRAVPKQVRELRARGVEIVLHSTGLSLGGADFVDSGRLERLARLADATGACLVSDHVCFVRASGLESGHLLPVPLNELALEVLTENVAAARSILPVPLALENIASFVCLPGGTMREPEFLSALLEQTGTSLLLDVANLHANALNHGFDPFDWLKRAPLHRLAYVHLAGGHQHGGLYHDTHCHPLPRGPLDLLAEVRARTTVPGAMLERDDHFPARDELYSELDAISETL